MIKELLIILLLLSVFGIASESDSDFDTIPDFKDKYPYDFDNDGLPDSYESLYHLDKMKVNSGDSDLDGLSDIKEYNLSLLGFNSDPTKLDTDSDGLSDLEEYEKGTNPNNRFSPIDKKIPILGGVLLALLIVYIFLHTSDLSKLKEITTLILGPNVKKALQEKEKKKKEFEENEKKEHEDKQEEELKRIEISKQSKVDPKSFLVMTLNKSKKKNEKHHFLEDFDKEEGLTFFKEKKTKQEIIDFLKEKKNKKKILKAVEKVVEKSVFEELDEIGKNI